MHNIRVGFSHSTSLFSKLIMWATSSQVSHAYIRLTDETVYQASGLSVNEMAYEYFLTYETVVQEFNIVINDSQFEQGEQFRKTSLGKPYSLKEILGFGLVLVARRLGKNISNPLKDGNQGYVCSKLVCDYLGIADDNENITPDDLYKLILTKYSNGSLSGLNN